MVKKEAIDAAITAHAAWKQSLLAAIENGTSEFEPNTTKLPDQCMFGK